MPGSTVGTTWESTYYNDFQSGSGETNVFQSARTFGIDAEFQEDGFARGRTGWNYTNGDGVLFYPGTDMVYPEESYELRGPLASLRLKQWRRGIQDVDYLVLAEQQDPAATQAIVERNIPHVLWEYGTVDPATGENQYDRSGEGYAHFDISWSLDPDDWEAARKELAEIIEN